MVYLKRIRLNNFLSHVDTAIGFEKETKLIIDGASGAGKSSIVDAIIWALYGQGRSDNRNLIHRGAKKAEVELELTNFKEQTGEEEIVCITRSISNTGKHSLAISTAGAGGQYVALPHEGLRNLQNWIEKELIGASYTLFVNSAAYVQGGIALFVMQPAVKRKELLLEIVRADNYDEIYEEARQVMASLSGDKSRLEGRLSEVISSIDELEKRVEKKDYETTVASLMIRIGALETQKQNMEEKLRPFKDVDAALNVVQDIMNKAAEEEKLALQDYQTLDERLTNRKNLALALESYDAVKAKRDAAVLTLENARERLVRTTQNEKLRSELLSAKPQKIENYSKIEKAQLKLAELLRAPECPSGEKCPYSGDHPKHIIALQTEIDTLRQEEKEYKKKLTVWEQAFEAIPEGVSSLQILQEIKNIEMGILKTAQENLDQLAIIQSRYNAMTGIEESHGVAKERYDLRVSQHKKARQDFENLRLSIDNNEKDRLTTEYQTINEKLIEQKAVLSSIQAILLSIKKDEELLAQKQESIHAIRADLTRIEDKIRKVELVRVAFGSKGIKTLVIDYMLPRLEDQINETLSRMSDFRIQLDTQRASMDGEGAVEGLFINIINDVGEKMSWENYSGGEKLKITVAISEALASLQRVGFRMLDEIFFSLDENALEDFLVIVTKLQSAFRQVIMISHLPGVKGLFERRLEIRKQKGVSYIFT